MGQLAPTQEFPKGSKRSIFLSSFGPHRASLVSPMCQGLGLCKLGSTSGGPPDSRALMKQLPFQGKIPGRFLQESPEHLQPQQTWFLGDDIWIQAENSGL